MTMMTIIIIQTRSALSNNSRSSNVVKTFTNEIQNKLEKTGWGEVGGGGVEEEVGGNWFAEEN